MCWGPIGPRQIIAMLPLKKIFECFFNYKLNVRTGFLGPSSFGSDGNFMFCLHDRKVARGHCSGTFSEFCSYDISSK